MKKLVVAALVLAIAGIAAAGAVHVGRSFCDGVCPLTGRPIAAQGVCPLTGRPIAGNASPAATGDVSAQVAPASQDDSAATNSNCRRDCGARRKCSEKRECLDKQVESKTEATPAAEQP